LTRSGGGRANHYIPISNAASAFMVLDNQAGAAFRKAGNGPCGQELEVTAAARRSAVTSMLAC
jgi:hypothetical protein